MKKTLMLFLALFFLVSCASTSLAEVTVPSPNDDFYVLDQADVLEYETEGLVVFTNDLLKKACGAEIVVVTMPSLGGTPIDDFAYELINKWGVGDAKKQNGMVLVLDIGGDNYYTILGDGLSTGISDGKLKLLNNTYLEPDFAKKNYDAGVRAVFEQYVKEVSAVYGAGVSVADGQKLLDEYLEEEEVPVVTEAPAVTAAPVVTAAPRTRGEAQQTQAPAVTTSTKNSGKGGFNLTPIIVIAVVILVVVLILRSRKRGQRAKTQPYQSQGYAPPQQQRTTPMSTGGAARGAMWGMLAGSLLSRNRQHSAPAPRQQPAPPPQPFRNDRPSTPFGGSSGAGRTATRTPTPVRQATRTPTSIGRNAPSGGSSGSFSGSSSSSASRSSSRSTSGVGRTISNLTRSSTRSSSSGAGRGGGFGGGRSGGGGGSRGGGAGRGR